jgi:hypothetical protein
MLSLKPKQYNYSYINKKYYNLTQQRQHKEARPKQLTVFKTLGIYKYILRQSS